MNPDIWQWLPKEADRPWHPLVSSDICRHGMASILTWLEYGMACVAHACSTSFSPSTTSYMNTGVLESIICCEGSNIPQDLLDDLMLSNAKLVYSRVLGDGLSKIETWSTPLSYHQPTLLKISAVVVAHTTCLTESDRCPRNSSWKWARCTPVVGHSLEHYTVSCTRDSAHKTFGPTPTDLTNKYSVCTQKGIWRYGHRTPAFRSGVWCSNH
ncbi:hypothetical protein TNCV_3384861 [Trichonephila clavipes]|uniref:Uncharacterized protein n=1 Tax=Trichonephila clavipes TaxID=2585209 RepID=A0A8X6VQL8_TRICX|nr:hypothetical protein TNCV_3384861 [Trichonephila clavipes]